MSSASSAFTSYSEPRPAVLVVSGKEGLRTDLVQNLKWAHWRTLEAQGGADALSRLEESDCHVLLLDHFLPDIETGEMCSIAQSRFPGLDVVVLDEDGSAMAAGDTRSRMATELIQVLSAKQGQLLPRHRPANSAGEVADTQLTEPLPGMLGDSPKMRRVYELARLVAPRATPVLIAGATGTGKELVAAAIHSLSPRARKPLVTINCAAIPEALLESELFGYVRGAFTGAVQSRVGRIHAAHGGTLFLDEIGEMPLHLQSKLLRFLENGEVQRLGTTDVFRVDVRVVAATNQDLERKINRSEFREDLFYRLAVFPIGLPRLAQRGNDILKLAERFLSEFSPEGARLSEQAAERLRRHDWPGNVRELRHVMERASILAQSGDNPVAPTPGATGAPLILSEHILLSRSHAA